ncbi:SDR family oxidoreductase [Salininema proteolyticum]|uniref:SDR family oxidoreductase n=1 Tax=Salininema proteolyticum TaxID=1607685 RepID=A0ABV8U1I1_9ACTN
MPKTIVITGAGRGLGRALAEKFIARGDRVIAVVRSEQSLAGLRAAQTVIADLSHPDSLAAPVADAEIERADVLIHNAGVAHIGTVEEQPLEEWRQTMEVNVLAPVELTRLLLPALRRAEGHVVFVNSGAGLSASAQWGSYAASKHALKAVADTLRGEERAAGVRVSSLFPSHFDTDMQRQVREDIGAEYDPKRATSVASVADTVVGLVDAPSDMVFEDVRIAPPNPLSMSAAKF